MIGKRYILVLSMIIIYSFLSFGDIIKGTVTDASNNQPLENVKVSIQDQPAIATQTASDGTFEINTTTPIVFPNSLRGTPGIRWNQSSQVLYWDGYKSDISIRILSLQGRVHTTFSSPARNGTTRFQIPQLAPGIYFVSITSNNRTAIYKLVKMQSLAGSFFQNSGTENIRTPGDQAVSVLPSATNILLFEKQGYQSKTVTVEGSNENLQVQLVPEGNATTFHVAVDGDDSNPGTEAEPFATLHKARDAVRAANPPCNVIVHAGTYYFGSTGGTLVLGREDSGTEGAENVWMAAAGEEVTLSGGVKIEGSWQVHSGSIYKCTVPNNLAGDELFVNDAIQIAARFPNYVDADRFKQSGKTGYRQGCSKSGSSVSLTNLSSKSWNGSRLQSCGAYLDAFHDAYWGNIQWQITGRSGNSVTVGRGGFHLRSPYQGTRGVGGPSQYFCARIFEELDAQKEWVLDKDANTLYLYPESGVNLSSALVELSTLEKVLEIKGTRSSPVHHISFKGFRISHTQTTFLEDYQDGGININYSCGDWTIWRGGAVLIEGAEDIAIQNCHFDAVGGNGVFINNYAQRITVSDNKFSYTGESCVGIVGKSHINTQGYNCPRCNASHSWGWGTKSSDIPSNCTIHNNDMHDFGRHGKQTSGVYLALTKGNTISHNSIYNGPRAGICFNDGYWGGHVIEWNDVHDCVLETGDHGPINAWGRDAWWCRDRKGGPNDDHPFAQYQSAYFDEIDTTIIRYNRFAAGRAPSGWGMDLDDASSKYYFYSNLGVDIGFKVREGAHNKCENNIFYHSENQINIHSPSPENSLTFLRNIQVFDGNDLRGTRFGTGWPSSPKKWLRECDYNTWWGGSSFNAEIHTGPYGGGNTYNYNMSQWRGLGYGANSAYEDPQFADPDNGDFTVRNQNVLDRGFKNFPMDQFGITSKK